MAIKKVYELSVDLKKTTTRVNIPVLVQGDSAEFRIRLLDDGAPLSTGQLTGIAAVRMQSGYDAQTVIQTVGTLQGNVAVFRLQKGELFRSGTVQAMVQLEDSADRISTLRFQYQVIEDLTGNYIPGEQDLTIFQRYMDDAQAKIDEMAATDVAQLTAQLSEKIGQVDFEQLKKEKIDSVVLDENIIKFYAEDRAIHSIDVSAAGNAQEVRGYIDTLVSNGAIAGVTLQTKGIKSKNLADKSVLPAATTFARAGKNKFTGEYLNTSVTGGANGVMATTSGGKTVIVPVEPNTNVVVTYSGDTDRFRIYGNAGYPEPGESLDQYFTTSTAPTAIFNTGACDYLIIYISTPAQNKEPAWLQVEYGTTATPYTPSKVIIELEEKSVKPRMIDGIRLRGELVGTDDAFDISMETQKITTALSGGLVLVGNDRYSLKAGTWDFGAYSASNSVTIGFNINTADIEFFNSNEFQTAKDNIAYLGTIRKNRGVYYINGLHTYNGKKVLPASESSGGGGSGGSASKDFYITDIPDGMYKVEAPAAAVPERSVVTSDYVYGLYDAHIANHSDYVAGSLFGTEPTGLPINMYHLVPPTSVGTSVKFPHPRILLQSGIHGHEFMATLVFAKFIDDLCNNWQNSEVLRALRWNVQFDVIPVLNPWGLNAGANGMGLETARKNSNGVDLNRNQPPAWVYNSDPSHMNYGGEAPLSEVESQLLYEYSRANPDILIAIDGHNYGYYPDSNEYTLWLGSNVENTQRFFTGIGQQMTGRLREQYAIGDYSKSLARISSSTSAGGAVRQWESAGAVSCLFELPYRISDAQINEPEKVALTNSTEALGNLILAMLKNYHYLK